MAHEEAPAAENRPFSPLLARTTEIGKVPPGKRKWKPTRGFSVVDIDLDEPDG